MLTFQHLLKQGLREPNLGDRAVKTFTAIFK